MKLLMTIALMVLAGPALAQVSEADKITALKLGYELNGNSMTRWGSIDLTTASPAIVRTIPIDGAPKVLPPPRR